MAYIGEASLKAFDAAPETTRVMPQAIEIRVLAAEDNLTNQLVLKTLLHQLQIEPVVVANGAEAVQAWKENAFDLDLDGCADAGDGRSGGDCANPRL